MGLLQTGTSLCRDSSAVATDPQHAADKHHDYAAGGTTTATATTTTIINTAAAAPASPLDYLIDTDSSSTHTHDPQQHLHLLPPPHAVSPPAPQLAAQVGRGVAAWLGCVDSSFEGVRDVFGGLGEDCQLWEALGLWRHMAGARGR